MRTPTDPAAAIRLAGFLGPVVPAAFGWSAPSMWCCVSVAAFPLVTFSSRIIAQRIRIRTTPAVVTSRRGTTGGGRPRRAGRGRWRPKFNELLANFYSTALHITDAADAIAADGHPVDLDDLATISPYITHVIRRFGNWILNLTPPAANPTTRLDLESQVLFAHYRRLARRCGCSSAPKGCG
ncbi:hypothetical protein [Nonomuraea roseola]|uniref:Tn3 transposase DDE domain-containing protein n=1 Tax=Nonomuraea roseola TaxID=46179 RepID=A0ABV5QE76_9ACTN